VSGTEKPGRSPFEKEFVMKLVTVTALIFSFAHCGAGAAAAQHPAPARPRYERQIPAALLAQAKVTEDSARALALAKVPGGTVESVELVREQGKVTWVWDIKVSGKRGITEVSVNAIDGSVAAHAE
jgi:uncharacterized membrane protein YkoI